MSEKKLMTVEKPCWYKVAEVGPDTFDEDVLSRLYDDDYDRDLSPLIESIRDAATHAEELYGIAESDQKPVTHVPKFMHEAWWMDEWQRLVTYDLDEKAFVVWRKGTYETEELVEIVEEPEGESGEEDNGGTDE